MKRRNAKINAQLQVVKGTFADACLTFVIGAVVMVIIITIVAACGSTQTVKAAPPECVHIKHIGDVHDDHLSFTDDQGRTICKFVLHMKRLYPEEPQEHIVFTESGEKQGYKALFDGSTVSAKRTTNEHLISRADVYALQTVPTSTPTKTSTPTDTDIPPTETFTPTFTLTFTPTWTSTFTATWTPTSTSTATNTPTGTLTPSNTPTVTPTGSTVTSSPTLTITGTLPPSPTPTETPGAPGDSPTPPTTLTLATPGILPETGIGDSVPFLAVLAVISILAFWIARGARIYVSD